MSTDEGRIKKKLSALSNSLDDLEAILEPLFSKSFPETVLGLETIQQAKLQTVLPYLVYDLIFSKLTSICPYE
jgi:exosome complex protein LRP1